MRRIESLDAGVTVSYSSADASYLHHMRQIQPFADERFKVFCAVCGNHPWTREHAPPKIFLDKPYPENLPIVSTCLPCNEGHSMDEEYVACLVECTRLGTTEPDQLERADIRRILVAKPALHARLAAAHRPGFFDIELPRVQRIMLKLARCHAMFELGETALEDPLALTVTPLVLLDSTAREDFESPERFAVWPEVGSRAMQRLITGGPKDAAGWVTVQSNRYRYCSNVRDGFSIRMVVSEYLATQVVWG